MHSKFCCNILIAENDNKTGSAKELSIKAVICIFDTGIWINQ